MLDILLMLGFLFTTYAAWNYVPQDQQPYFFTVLTIAALLILNYSRAQVGRSEQEKSGIRITTAGWLLMAISCGSVVVRSLLS